jgi:hypothetical protein
MLFLLDTQNLLSGMIKEYTCRTPDRFLEAQREAQGQQDGVKPTFFRKK